VEEHAIMKILPGSDALGRRAVDALAEASEQANQRRAAAHRL
jgi:hypothetical protein